MPQNPYQPPQDEQPRAANAKLEHEILLRGSMPVRDVIHTQWLLILRRWRHILICVTTYVAFVIVLGMMNPVGSLFIFLGLVVAPGILPFTMLMIYIRLQQDCRKQVGIFAVTESRLTEVGIETVIKQKDVCIPWNSFGSFLKSSEVILLFLTESNDHLIVSRVKLVDPADWSRLLDFLHERLPGG